MEQHHRRRRVARRLLQADRRLHLRQQQPEQLRQCRGHQSRPGRNHPADQWRFGPCLWHRTGGAAEVPEHARAARRLRHRRQHDLGTIGGASRRGRPRSGRTHAEPAELDGQSAVLLREGRYQRRFVLPLHRLLCDPIWRAGQHQRVRRMGAAQPTGQSRCRLYFPVRAEDQLFGAEPDQRAVLLRHRRAHQHRDRRYRRFGPHLLLDHHLHLLKHPPAHPWGIQLQGFLFGRHIVRLFALLAFFLISAVQAAEIPPKTPPIGHVYVLVLENENFETTFGPNSVAPYLAKELPVQGAMLDHYYGIGHYSLDNYIAMISGQAPNPVTQDDCPTFSDFAFKGWAKDHQAIGQGCVYPASVKTLADQMEAKHLTWHGYMEDMGKDPAREAARCGHPTVGTPDGTEDATEKDKYATRHDPFVYFHSIIDRPSCAENVVPLDGLEADLADAAKTANLSFITPNLCNDGHDQTCADGGPAGLEAADAFLRHGGRWIFASPAFKQDGLLIVTFDEADVPDPKNATDNFESCCGEQPGPNIKTGAKIGKRPDSGPGIYGAGGGRTGAVLLSPFIKPGTLSSVPYNHYAMLKSLEDMFGLTYLGYAGQKGLVTFGKDVFTGSASTPN